MKYSIDDSTLRNIANPLREIAGTNDTMTPAQMATEAENAAAEVDAQGGLIDELKSAIAENVSKTSEEITTQSDLIDQIKTALEGKAGGGVQLPALTNPGSAEDLADGKQLIDANGNVVTGNILVFPDYLMCDVVEKITYDDGAIDIISPPANIRMMVDTGGKLRFYIPGDLFGNAKPENVAQGVFFTSAYGLEIEGTAQVGGGGGMVVKSGTTTSRTINTGLSDVEHFIIYKETQTATGLIHLHYSKAATSRMYASAWSTNNYGTKTITNGTGGVTVSGGTVTISATQAAQGALTSNVTYKWIAIGTE